MRRSIKKQGRKVEIRNFLYIFFILVFIGIVGFRMSQSIYFGNWFYGSDGKHVFDSPFTRILGLQYGTTMPPTTTTSSTTTTTIATTTSSTTTSSTTTTLPSVSQNQITLYNGWNLISFTMKTITSISPDNCNIVPKLFHYYNAQTKTWEDYKWNQLVGGKAYWIYSDKSSSCTTDFSGPWELVTAADIPSLKTGYNLVGTKSNTPYSFSSTKGTCSVSIGPLYWNNVNKNWETATTFEANKGYWLYVDSDCSLV